MLKPDPAGTDHYFCPPIRRGTSRSGYSGRGRCRTSRRPAGEPVAGVDRVSGCSVLRGPGALCLLAEAQLVDDTRIAGRESRVVGWSCARGDRQHGSLHLTLEGLRQVTARAVPRAPLERGRSRALVADRDHELRVHLVIDDDLRRCVRRRLRHGDRLVVGRDKRASARGRASKRTGSSRRECEPRPQIRSPIQAKLTINERYPQIHYGNRWGKRAYKFEGANRELTMIYNGIALSAHRNMYRLSPHLLP
jgi:hypothetical protein